METIIAATKNAHKIEEIQAIMEDLGFTVISRDAAGVPDFEVEETGETFAENSLLKAQAILDCTGRPTIADDSGLCCDYLDGAPGVYSSRFAGEDGADGANNAKLAALTRPVPEKDRTAHYACVITLLFPDGRKYVAEGRVYGHIVTEPRGENGFGYDPYFVPEGEGVLPGDTRTFAEYSPEEKNAISHRGRALQALRDMLTE